MTAPRQLPLPLPPRSALGRDDYFVSEANATLVAQIDGWRAWPNGKLVLVGPQGSGKTHLAHVWARQSGARFATAHALAPADLPTLSAGPVCVEDVPKLAGDPEAERALFHLHNLATQAGNPMLLTADRPPAQWALGLPDLTSRMMALHVAIIPRPDDALLGAVLVKLFADRRSVPARDVIPYLVRHMPRSFDMARHIVETLDAAAMGRRSGVTRRLAAETLSRLETPGPLLSD